MRKFLIAGVIGASMLVPAAAQAAAPYNFGTARAANLQTYYLNGGGYDVSPGSSEWGAEASNRAGDNGTMNQEWRATYAPVGN
jgi:hypothetical protein